MFGLRLIESLVTYDILGMSGSCLVRTLITSLTFVPIDLFPACFILKLETIVARIQQVLGLCCFQIACPQDVPSS